MDHVTPILLNPEARRQVARIDDGQSHAETLKPWSMRPCHGVVVGQEN